jgi:hypothetical protein
VGSAIQNLPEEIYKSIETCMTDQIFINKEQQRYETAKNFQPILQKNHLNCSMAILQLNV